MAAIIEANSRLPRETIGQHPGRRAAALRLGAQKLADVVERFGFDVYRARASISCSNRASARCDAVIDGFADGVYTATDWLDDNGIESRQVPSGCTVTVRGSEMTVDTTGSAPQQEGPFNSTLPMTTAACRLALKRLTTEDRLPSNSGEHRPLRVIAPEGFDLPRDPPAATFEMALTAQRLGELIHAASGPAAEARIPGSERRRRNVRVRVCVDMADRAPSRSSTGWRRSATARPPTADGDDRAVCTFRWPA